MKVTANLKGHERTENSSQTPVRRRRRGQYRGHRHVGEGQERRRVRHRGRVARRPA